MAPFPRGMETAVVKMRLMLPIIGLVFCGVLAYSCSASKASGAPQAVLASRHDALQAVSAASRDGVVQLRFVNAMPGSPPLELGQDSLLLFSNVLFGGVSPYKTVRRGTRLLTLRYRTVAGCDASIPVTLLDGERYTVIAVSDTNGILSLRVVLDDLEPERGLARVRVVNAAAGVGDVVVRLRGADDPFMTAVNGTALAQVRDVAPTTTGFSVRSLTNAPLVVIKALPLLKGNTYTFVLASRPHGPVTAIPIVDSHVEFAPVAPVAKR